MAYFPMMIELKDKDVLVIGGGEEGLKKVKVLSSLGAKVTLVSPFAEEEAISLSYEYCKRSFVEGDIDAKAYIMVVTATDDRDLNRRISELATQRHIPVNVVDDVELCTFIFPAIYQQKDVVCAVSSGGKSPYVAQYVRNRLAESMPDNIGDINEKMGTLREEAKLLYEDSVDRRAFLKAKFLELLEAK
jgi:siroheme synthase-like protein